MKRTKLSLIALISMIILLMYDAYQLYQTYINLINDESASGIDGLPLTIGIMIFKILFVSFICHFFGWFFQSIGWFIVALLIHLLLGYSIISIHPIWFFILIILFVIMPLLAIISIIRHRKTLQKKPQHED